MAAVLLLRLCRRVQGHPQDRHTFLPLLRAMESELFREKDNDLIAWQAMGYY